MRRHQFGDVAEAFRRYWEADTDTEFRRADWAARMALYRYARRLYRTRQKKGAQRTHVEHTP